MAGIGNRALAVAATLTILIAGPSSAADRHMIAAAHPLAAEAGLEMLRAGGSALDAALAAQFVLGLVEPQSSGLGGGAFILHWNAGTRSLAAFDGRETAPAAAKPDRFLAPDGKPLRFIEAAVGGSSVGVPGLLRVLELAHAKHGKLAWARLFEPAIRHAEAGFAISPRLHRLLAEEQEMRAIEPARSYFYRPDGAPRAAGEILQNPAYAETLRALAGSAGAFYSGAIAADIVATVAGAPRNPGDLTLADLAAYRAVERSAVCGAYRVYRICGMPPPTSGGVAVLQILSFLEPFEMKALKPLSVEAAHLFAEAGKLAFADRDRYLADPDHVAVPVAGLLDNAYLKGRGALIRSDRASGRAEPGEPPRKAGLNWIDGTSPELPATSHISVVDAAGDAVSMTTTIESGFGSRLMVRGFLLNNQLTDFSFVPEAGGMAVANAVAPGKRPRSSMSPTLVFGPDGRLRLVTGSPGGAQIIGYAAQSLIAVLDWGLDPQSAAALPHYGNRNGPTELEADTQAATLKSGLEALGHEVRVVPMVSGLHLIAVEGGKLVGGADPRREGRALGD
jgi:gamma-glutamyltranspeptidase / glutathione hydrolase